MAMSDTSYTESPVPDIYNNKSSRVDEIRKQLTNNCPESMTLSKLSTYSRIIPIMALEIAAKVSLAQMATDISNRSGKQLNESKMSPKTCYNLTLFKNLFPNLAYYPMTTYLSSKHDLYPIKVNDINNVQLNVYKFAQSITAQIAASNAVVQIIVTTALNAAIGYSSHTINTDDQKNDEPLKYSSNKPRSSSASTMATYDLSKWSIDRILRHCNITNIEAGKCKTIEIIWNYDNNTADVCISTAITVPDGVIANKQRGWILFNGINVSNKLNDSWTSSYILMNGMVDIDSWITNNDGRFGQRMIKNDFETIMPRILIETNKNIKFEVKDDGDYDKYDKLLFSQQTVSKQDKIGSIMVNKLDTILIQSINEWNNRLNVRDYHKMNIHEIRSCFTDNGIRDISWFQNHKRGYFVRLIVTKHGVAKLEAANKLWDDFGGVLEREINKYEEKEDDNITDIDLNELNANIEENAQLMDDGDDVGNDYKMEEQQKEIDHLKRINDKQQRVIRTLKKENQCQAALINALRRRYESKQDTDNDEEDISESTDDEEQSVGVNNVYYNGNDRINVNNNNNNSLPTLPPIEYPAMTLPVFHLNESASDSDYDPESLSGVPSEWETNGDEMISTSAIFNILPSQQNNDNDQFEYPPWDEYEDKTEQDQQDDAVQDVLYPQDEEKQSVEINNASQQDIDHNMDENDDQYQFEDPPWNQYDNDVYNDQEDEKQSVLSNINTNNDVNHNISLSVASYVVPIHPTPTLPPNLIHVHTATILPTTAPFNPSTSIATYPSVPAPFDPSTAAPTEYSSNAQTM